MLANEAFTSKASPQAVAKNRDKLAAYEDERARTRRGLETLSTEDGR